ncbi:MAG: hypothetical protein ACRD0K_26790 [Egibacteraceae bacterium]
MTVGLADDVRARLRARAGETRETPTALAQRLIDEGLRTESYPGVVFRPTSSGGRIAGLAGGPDVAEVVQVIKELEASGEDAIAEAAEWLGLTARHIRAALRYYAAFPDEIDAERKRRHDAAKAAYPSLKRERKLLE